MQVAAVPASSATWISRRPVGTALPARSLNPQTLPDWSGRRQAKASVRGIRSLKHSVASAEMLGMGLEAGFGPAPRIQKRAAASVRAQAAGSTSLPTLLSFATLPTYSCTFCPVVDELLTFHIGVDPFLSNLCSLCH